MSKFIIEIKLENGENKQVKVCVDNKTAEILNKCDVHTRQIFSWFTHVFNFGYL